VFRRPLRHICRGQLVCTSAVLSRLWPGVLCYGFWRIFLRHIFILILFNQFRNKRGYAEVSKRLLLELFFVQVFLFVFAYGDCGYYVEYLFNPNPCYYANIRLLGGLWSLVTSLLFILLYAVTLVRVIGSAFRPVPVVEQPAPTNTWRRIGIIFCLIIVGLAVEKFYLPRYYTMTESKDKANGQEFPSVNDFVFLRNEGSTYTDLASDGSYLIVPQRIVVFTRTPENNETILKEVTFSDITRPNAFLSGNGKILVYTKNDVWYKVPVSASGEGVTISAEEARRMDSTNEYVHQLLSPDGESFISEGDTSEDGNSLSYDLTVSNGEKQKNFVQRIFISDDLVGDVPDSSETDRSLAWLDNTHLLVAELNTPTGARLFTKEVGSGKEVVLLQGKNGAGFFIPIIFDNKNFLLGIWEKDESSILDGNGKVVKEVGMEKSTARDWSSGVHKSVYEVTITDSGVKLALTKIASDMLLSTQNTFNQDKTKLLSYSQLLQNSENRDALGKLNIRVINLKKPYTAYTKTIYLPGIHSSGRAWFVQ